MGRKFCGCCRTVTYSGSAFRYPVASLIQNRQLVAATGNLDVKLVEEASACNTALTVTTFAASAADIARPVYKAAPVASAHNWSGFYVGGVVGAGLMSSEFADLPENLSYGYMHKSKWGFSAGGTVGYNWQAGAAVFGVEGDLSWASLDQTLNSGYTDASFNTKWNWYGTVRARAGVAVDNALFYVTGGVAFVDAKYKAYDMEYGCGGDYCADSTKTQTGFAAGAGVEYAFASNWSAKLEYLYIGLPTRDVDDSSYPGYGYNYSFKSDAHFVRAGLNYKFGH
jgi:outer membrane immunogenic protein